jgi:hypothetical protein
VYLFNRKVHAALSSSRNETHGEWKWTKETVPKILKSNKDPNHKWRLTADVTIAASSSVLVAVH